ncbi:MAG TPA: GTPase RsgA [Vicinamibacterales bacterium]|nr:GTPase RsgA [Vicinamibacterales bacterium]
MSLRERVGWSPFFEQQLARLERRDLLIARIVEEQRGRYRVAGDADGWAEVSGRFRHEAACAADFPAVGDWVGIDAGIIHLRLERRGTVSRAAAGRAADRQVVAANVDIIFLVSALTQDLNVRRLERYLTMVWDAGAVPVVVLNKADLCEDSAGACESVRVRLPTIDVVVVSALDKPGLEALTPYIRPGQTLALVGSSGVGKSTLVNRLLGAEALKVGALRDPDGKGRHTATRASWWNCRAARCSSTRLECANCSRWETSRPWRPRSTTSPRWPRRAGSSTVPTIVNRAAQFEKRWLAGGSMPTG